MFPQHGALRNSNHLQPSGLFYGETRCSDLPKVTLGPCGSWVSASGVGSSGPALQLLSSLPPASPQHRGVGPALPGPLLSKHLFLLDLEETCPLVQTMPSLTSEPTTHSKDEPGSLLEKALVLNSSQVLCKQTSDRCLPDSVPTVRSRGALMSGSRRLPISMAYLGPAHSCCPQPGWVFGRAPSRLQPTVHRGPVTQQAFT